MKKFILGNLLYVSGFIWMTFLMVLSILHPYVVNGIDGFLGFLIGTDTVIFFIVALVLIIVGLTIVFTDAGHKLHLPKKTNFHKKIY